MRKFLVVLKPNNQLLEAYNRDTKELTQIFVL